MLPAVQARFSGNLALITDYCGFAFQCLLLLQVHSGKDFLQYRGHRASNVYYVMALLR